MDTKLLKQKILDLAIRGKLVPQDPNDEPASILLEKIRKEKQELIKQGKIKKDKNESTIFVGDDKQHYEKMIEEQPLNWTVIRLNEVLYYEQPTNYIVTSTEYCDSYKTPVLTAGKSFILGYTNEATGIYNNLPCIIFDDFTTDSKFVNFPFKVKSSAMKILTNNKYVSLKFIYYSMQTIDCIVDTHKRFWISDYSNKPVYLPPLAEQQRIVNKIEELFAQVDKIEEEKQSLLKLIDKAKDKVLDLAMKGKLVKQDPNDEPASVLLEKIFEEKKKLAKDGKIKLSKDELLEPKISDDNDYYDHYSKILPKKWVLTKIGLISEINLGFTHTPKYVENGVPFLSVKDISKGKLDFSKCKYVSEQEYNTAAYGSKPQKGDILFGRVGTIGKPQIIDFDKKFCIFVSLGFFRLFSFPINKNYIVHWINSSLFDYQVKKHVKGTAQINLNTGWLKDFIIPLPPISEQQRIVDTIENLLNKIEQIKDSL